MTAPPSPLFAPEWQPLGAADVPAAARQCPDLFADATWSAAAVGRLLDGPGCFALLARTAGRSVGLVLFRVAADECEILWVFVGPASRRGGLGRGLLRDALGRAASLGARTAYLEVAAANRPAICLYREEGFRCCGRRKAYYQRAPEGASSDALIYRKALEPAEETPGRSPSTA